MGLTDYRGEPMEQHGDPNRTDVYLCINCTIRLGDGTMGFHRWDDLAQHPDGFCAPPFGRNVLVAYQIAYFHYEHDLHKMETPYLDINELLGHCMNEQEIGLRNPDQKPLHPNNTSTLFSDIAKCTDSTDRPMFPDEIEDFVAELRQGRDTFPTAYQDTPFFALTGHPLSLAMCEGELLHLCSYMNSQTIGSGSQLMAGHLVSDKITEAQVAKYWEDSEREVNNARQRLLDAITGRTKPEEGHDD